MLKTISAYTRCMLVLVCAGALGLASATGLLACGGGSPPDASDSPGTARRWQAAIGGPRGDQNPCGSPADSINTFTGNLTVYDIPVSYGNVGQPMPFAVVFNSTSGRTGTLGDRWTHSFNWRVISDAPYGVFVVDGWGGETYFTGYGLPYEAPPGVFDQLTAEGGGYKLTKPDKSSYQFDSSGTLTGFVDRNGRAWTLTYTSGRLTTITDPIGRATTLSYTNNLLTQVSVPGGLYATFQYDTYTPKRLWKITDAVGDTYTFGYSGTRVTGITDPSGAQAWYSYGTFNNKTVLASSGITNVPGSTVSYTHAFSGLQNEALLSDVTAQKDGQDRTDLYVYENADNPETGLYYGTLRSRSLDSGGLSLDDYRTYDSELRLNEYVDSFQPEETGGKAHGHYYYYTDTDNPGSVTKYVDPENAGLPGTPGYVIDYDSYPGTPWQITTPEGRVTQLSYYYRWLPSQIVVKDADINGNPVDRTTSFTYYPDTDPAYRRKQLQSATDGRGNVTTYYYDANGYIDYVDLPGGNAPPAKDIDYTCNAVGPP